ncbi:MAG: 30S ribosomal protein S12 methylthiotransferase RimO [Clostridia bacterium]|nr:30S ribosomal protein S12 methylthiotransferase RimO [Clostridia bacterium]
MNVGFISLGCSKNLIDTEVAIGEFKNNNFKIVNDPSEAEIIVINTCGFIESAKEEAINTILEMAEYKKQKCKYLIAMGCLVQRYYNDLIKLLPEVDLFIRIDEYTSFWEKIEELLKEKEVKPSKLTRKANSLKPIPMVDPESFIERVVTTGKKYAYLKIGEGCSNNCTYCAIPYIRGAFISRPMEDILKEAQILAEQGYEEIIVIAQDTTKYGVDLYGKTKLAEILHKISEIKGIKWIRFLYSYPEGITTELIQEVKNNPKIIKYFDIPIQHISNDLLKRMNRKTSKENIQKLIKTIRKEMPKAILRTSIIVGFPGETKEQFDELLEFVEIAQFDKLGAFTYSKEEGTPAAKMPNQIHGNTKKARYNKLMAKQQKISKQKLEEKIGETIETLIEDISFDGKYLIGRTKNDVPEIDGIIYIENPSKDAPNEYINKFVNCKIENVNNYDLIGKIVK